MFWGLDNFFHPRHDPVFLFAYNTKRTIEFTLSWIFFFLENWVLDFFSECLPGSLITIKWSLPKANAMKM